MPTDMSGRCTEPHAWWQFRAMGHRGRRSQRWSLLCTAVALVLSTLAANDVYDVVPFFGTGFRRSFSAIASATKFITGTSCVAQYTLMR